MVKVSVIIPTYNKYDLTHALLGSLYSKERNNIDHVLVIDNGSEEETVQQGLSWWMKDVKDFNLHVLTMEENSGFLLAANEGLQMEARLDDSKPEDIMILLSNDVLIHAPFICQLVGHLALEPKSLVGGILYSSSTGWNVFGGNPPIPYLEGWLLATTVRGWGELGYFDERFAPNDYEDMDLSMTAKKLGYKLVPLNNPSIVHLGGRTLGYTDSRLKLTNINKEKFREKWSL